MSAGSLRIFGRSCRRRLWRRSTRSSSRPDLPLYFEHRVAAAMLRNIFSCFRYELTQMIGTSEVGRPSGMLVFVFRANNVSTYYVEKGARFTIYRYRESIYFIRSSVFVDSNFYLHIHALSFSTWDVFVRLSDSANSILVHKFRIKLTIVRKNVQSQIVREKRVISRTVSMKISSSVEKALSSFEIRDDMFFHTAVENMYLTLCQLVK